MSKKNDVNPLYSEGDLLTMAKNSFATLAEAIKAGKSEQLVTYLNFVALFPKYSRHNRMLIEEQMPHATHIQSYKQWKDAGYQVAKHAVGIRILKPLLKTKKHEDTDEEEEVLHGFLPVSVFDVSQLLPEDQARVPHFFPTIHGDYEAVYQRILTAATVDGYHVTEVALTASEGQGYSLLDDISIKQDMTSGNKVLTTVHEWTHAKLHWKTTQKDRTVQIKECHAAAVQYIVATHFGVPAPYSVDYLISWGTTEKLLQQELDIVSSTAVAMMKAITALEASERSEEGSS